MSTSALAKQPILIKLVIPADMITKHALGESDMRQCIDRAFNHCLGRCDWNTPQVIICTLEQFGLFCALLSEKGMAGRIATLNISMFREMPQPKVCIFNAVGKGMKPVHVDVMAMPSETVAEIS